MDRLEIVEYLRRTHGVRGAMVDFRVDERECLVTFKAPAYSADAFIERPDGRYQLTQTTHGVVAFLNDLHKGRDSGPVWSILIDVSAVLLTIISITGTLLLLTLKRRRRAGLIVGLVGTVAAGRLFSALALIVASQAMMRINSFAFAGRSGRARLTA